MRDAGTGASRVALDAIQKVGAGKNTGDAGANSIVETAATLPRPLVKRQRRFDVGWGHRMPIRAAGEICEDLVPAAGLVQTRTRGALRRDAADAHAGMADKEPLPAGPFAQAVHV